MAKERRQFIGLTDTQAQSFNGLDREITVSTDSDTLRLHTKEEPHGILLANKTDVSSLDSRIANLESDSVIGITQLFGFICNITTTDPDISSLYPYMARVSISHLTAQNHDTIAYVMFSPADAVSGNFAPFVTYENASTGADGYVTIYSKVEMTETHYAKIALADIRRAD